MDLVSGGTGGTLLPGGLHCLLIAGVVEYHLTSVSLQGNSAHWFVFVVFDVSQEVGPP